jgi:hypothetical protein
VGSSLSTRAIFPPGCRCSPAAAHALAACSDWLIEKTKSSFGKALTLRCPRLLLTNRVSSVAIKILGMQYTVKYATQTADPDSIVGAGT